MLLSLLAVLLSAQLCRATGCGQPSQCVAHLCPQPKYCPLGATTEPCGCCKVCLKKEGELCGGPDGACGLGFTCNTTGGAITGKCQRLAGCHLYNSYLAVGTAVQWGECSECECVKDRDLHCRRNMTKCSAVRHDDTPVKNAFPELNYIENTPVDMQDNHEPLLP
uniref:Serine protease HTRA1A-like protein n=1 Tax=Halisarca dujardinii TaxID=2583056 RepID=A0AA96MI76_HALDU|nr:serine protease HTRA1A-like protein [Halisarca dujardinii]